MFRWRDIEETRSKNVLGQYKIFSYFLIFLRRERGLGLEFFEPSRSSNNAHPKFFIQKSVNFEGSRMLRYGVISDWKMIFLHEVIEKFSVFYKDFNYRWWFFEIFFTFSDRICEALALTSKLKIWNNFFYLFIKANFEILRTDLDTRPKISVLTFESLSGTGCSVREL